MLALYIFNFETQTYDRHWIKRPVRPKFGSYYGILAFLTILANCPGIFFDPERN